MIRHYAIAMILRFHAIITLRERCYAHFCHAMPRRRDARYYAFSMLLIFRFITLIARLDYFFYFHAMLMPLLP